MRDPGGEHIETDWPRVEVWPMAATVWTLGGLTLDIAGILVLAFGDTVHRLAFARYTASDDPVDWFRTVARRPWWLRPALRLAVLLGPRDPMAMNDDAPLDAAAKRLVGYGLILLGFIAQAIGALMAR